MSSRFIFKAVAITNAMICLLSSQCALAAKLSLKKKQIPPTYIRYIADLHDPTVSPEAIQLSDLLKIDDKLKEVQSLHEKRASGLTLTHEELERYRDLKQDITEIIEQTRLEIEFADSEMEREEAVYSEFLAAYVTDRDNRVNHFNALGFRTNGVLWAVAEGLDIPTYKNPKLSIPSGTIGIVAGLVPSAFSLFALRETAGERFIRQTHPNMLSKIFGYEVSPEIDYPDSVWKWLNSVAPGDLKDTRLEFMHHWWQHDVNLRYFSAHPSKSQLDIITGVDNCTSIQVLNDRLSMLRSLRGTMLGMNRPLLELMMVVRGVKKMQ